jgi:hypothetical protein
MRLEKEHTKLISGSVNTVDSGVECLGEIGRSTTLKRLALRHLFCKFYQQTISKAAWHEVSLTEGQVASEDGSNGFAASSQSVLSNRGRNGKSGQSSTAENEERLERRHVEGELRVCSQAQTRLDVDEVFSSYLFSFIRFPSPQSPVPEHDIAFRDELLCCAIRLRSEQSCNSSWKKQRMKTSFLTCHRCVNKQVRETS